MNRLERAYNAGYTHVLSGGDWLPSPLNERKVGSALRREFPEWKRLTNQVQVNLRAAFYDGAKDARRNPSLGGIGRALKRTASRARAGVTSITGKKRYAVVEVSSGNVLRRFDRKSDATAKAGAATSGGAGSTRYVVVDTKHTGAKNPPSKSLGFNIAEGDRHIERTTTLPAAKVRARALLEQARSEGIKSAVLGIRDEASGKLRTMRLSRGRITYTAAPKALRIDMYTGAKNPKRSKSMATPRHHKGKTYRLKRKPMFGKSAYVIELTSTGQALGYRMKRSDAVELAGRMGLRKAATKNPKARLGSGGRFKKCVTSVKSGARRKLSTASAKAICASAGRKKYGAKKMAKMAATGRRRAAAKRNPSLPPEEARRILRSAGAPIGGDFHALRSSVVDRLLQHADNLKYRKPKNASGSRGRYFHDYLQRRAGSKAKMQYNPKRKTRSTARRKAAKRTVRRTSTRRPAARKRAVARKPGSGKHWLTDRLGRPVGSRTGYPSLAAAREGAARIRARSSKIIKIFRGPKTYMQTRVWGGKLTAKKAA